MEAVLLIDFGSTYTKVTAVDLNAESVLGTSRAFTTVNTGINEGLEKALQDLNSSIGRINYTSTLACSSAAGGLKMIAVGLVPDLTAEAAKRAALSAGAKVLKVYAYEITSKEIEEISKLEPDIVLLTGGTDGGNKDVILHNAKLLSQIKREFPVVLAGNKSVEEEVVSLLAPFGKKVTVCENVMPELGVLNIEPAQDAIRDIFLQRIVRAKGLTKVENIIEGILMPTPSAVLNAAKLLSTGYGEEKGLGDLIVADVGGATTDIFSIAAGNPTLPGVVFKGLPEPFMKRTVEGDLGLRYSASALIEAIGLDAVAHASGLDPGIVEKYIKQITENPGILPAGDEYLELVDYGLASMAMKYGVERHVGKVETTYSIFGVSYIQTGKDLSDVKLVIGTGGVIVNSRNSKGIFQEAVFDPANPAILKPKNPEFLIDKKYIMAAMGLLGDKYPEIAIRMLKKELKAVV